jgi:deoxyribonuclease V
MDPSLHHGWDLNRDAARRLQATLATEVVHEDDFSNLRSVAGIQISYPRTASGAVIGRAAVTMLTLPDLEVLEQRIVFRSVTFPYIPGLRSFREAPLALAALELLPSLPDLLLVDGHGTAHSQRFGVASHIGLLLDVPTIGCASMQPIGVAQEPADVAGAWTPLVDNDEVIGAAVRARSGSRPVYVSSGHRVSLESAISMVLSCTRGHRQPEPLRLATRLPAGLRQDQTTAP